MVTRRAFRFVAAFAAFAALTLAPYAAQAACSAAPTATTTDGILNFTSNPPAYGQVTGISPISGSLVYDGTNKLFKYCDGTNWLTLGATGTAAGSTGYVQFNTGGSLNADSDFYWDNTNKRLGIGTSTPSAPLHIGQTVRLGQNSAGAVDQFSISNTSGNAFFYVSTTASTGATVGAWDNTLSQAAQLTLWGNPVILGGGNVGIGTTNMPSYLLSFGGDAARTVGMERRTTANTAGQALTILAGGATSGATDKNGGDLVLSSGTATGTGSSGITFKTATAGSTGTADRTPAMAMTISGDGNVGIGTTTPEIGLTVYGGNNWGMLHLVNWVAGNAATISFKDSSLANGAATMWHMGKDTTANNDVFFIATGNTKRLTINTSGNVGIGTASPARALEVQASGVNGYLRVGNPTNYLETGFDGSNFRFDVSGSGNILFGYNSGASRSIGFYPSGTTTSQMVITSSGNVGIGTTTVNATLDVNGYAKLKTNTAAPVACSATYKGSIAMTSTTNYICYCDGTSWKQIHSPATACTW